MPTAPVPLAGLHVSTMPWVHQRRVAVLASEGVNDVLPSGVEGVGSPVHAVAVVAMGIHLIDNADLDAVSATSQRLGRNEFMFSMAPLVLERGTASPVNPLAIF